VVGGYGSRICAQAPHLQQGPPREIASLTSGRNHMGYGLFGDSGRERLQLLGVSSRSPLRTKRAQMERPKGKRLVKSPPVLILNPTRSGRERLSFTE
jgi:hypothetical protein